MAFFGRAAPSHAPRDGRDVILCDLDGVVYRGALGIEHAVSSLNDAGSNAKIAYLTNNASRTTEDVATQLQNLGLHAEPNDVVTSAQAAVRVLSAQVKPGARVLVVGGRGLRDEVSQAGFFIASSADDEPDAVIQGFAPDVSWNDLAEACYALGGTTESERPWIATNTDWTIPRERGLAPGNGTLVSAVHTAVGRLPIVAGKPELPIFATARDRFSARNPLFIGDRLDTDVKGAVRANIDSALVLTGVDGPKQLIAAQPDERPTYILSDLRGLAEPYPEVRVERGGTVRVGAACVTIEGNDVRILSDGGTPRGKDNIDLLRAACRAIWSSSISLYGLNVPERLYQ